MYHSGHAALDYVSSDGSMQEAIFWSSSDAEPNFTLENRFIVFENDVQVSELFCEWFRNSTEPAAVIEGGTYLIAEIPTLPDVELTNLANASMQMYTMTGNDTYGPLTEATWSIDSENIYIGSSLNTGDAITYTVADGWIYLNNDGGYNPPTDTTKMRTITDFSGCYCSEKEKAWFTANTTKLS